jgi:acetolactate decarboxylase
LKRSGDFGLGTVNGLNGEMVFLNDTFFRIDASGAVALPADSTHTPFADVTFFHAADTVDLEPGMTMDAATKRLDTLLPTMNIFYAVKIAGSFGTLRARSIPMQRPPYRPLQEVVKNQAVFTFSGVRGTIVGYRCPDYAGGMSVAGWHLHFIGDRRDKGGHVLGFVTAHCRAEVEGLRAVRLMLPDDSAFYHADLSGNKTSTINKVER